MAYIYMDESGDLGFSGRGLCSKYFIVTFLMSKSEKDCEIVMKHVRRRANGRKTKIYGSFFHSNNLSKNVVKRCLDLVSRREIVSMSIIVNKDNIPYNLKNNIHDLYNFLVGHLLEICQQKNLFSHGEKLLFIASRRETSKNLNNKFLEYLKSKKHNLLQIDFKIANPNQAKGLEVVDAISFAIHQKYEFDDLSLYSVIKNKIILEKQIF